MITYPNAKINLGLNIVEKRPDGYHNLETVFYPINLQDALEVNLMEGEEEFSFGTNYFHKAGFFAGKADGKADEGGGRGTENLGGRS